MRAMLERIGISLERSLLEQFDAVIERKGYVNRSEAIRDLIREQLVQREWGESAGGEKVAVVAIVYDHESSSLAQKSRTSSTRTTRRSSPRSTSTWTRTIASRCSSSAGGPARSSRWQTASWRRAE
jgi:Arc/MetJ-type ribon-helix-helix transcriptional regulator